jgi:GYF domain 2
MNGVVHDEAVSPFSTQIAFYGESNMTDEWYYAHDQNKIGPFSGRQMKDLATSGEILPTDTIWKAGVEKGVLACKVKNLFSLPQVILKLPLEKAAALPQLPARTPAEVTPPDTIVPVVVLADSAGTPLGKSVAMSNQPTVTPKPARKGRATAMKGADIVSQDGVNARYRKKCTECGQKDSACHTITITNKTTTVGYFCPKCRKNREVIIRCAAG